jgi:hypothetical protein
MYPTFGVLVPSNYRIFLPLDAKTAANQLHISRIIIVTMGTRPPHGLRMTIALAWITSTEARTFTHDFEQTST